MGTEEAVYEDFDQHDTVPSGPPDEALRLMSIPPPLPLPREYSELDDPTI